MSCSKLFNGLFIILFTSLDSSSFYLLYCPRSEMLCTQNYALSSEFFSFSPLPSDGNLKYDVWYWKPFIFWSWCLTNLISSDSPASHFIVCRFQLCYLSLLCFHRNTLCSWWRCPQDSLTVPSLVSLRSLFLMPKV